MFISVYCVLNVQWPVADERFSFNSDTKTTVALFASSRHNAIGVPELEKRNDFWLLRYSKPTLRVQLPKAGLSVNHATREPVSLFYKYLRTRTQITLGMYLTV